MLKIYLLSFLFIFSTNIKAQSNEQIGSKMADCAGWLFAASFMMRDIGNGVASTEYLRGGNASLDIAIRLIGKTKANDSIGTGMREYNQNKANGTLENWLPRLQSKRNECDAYLKTNNSQIRRALGQ